MNTPKDSPAPTAPPVRSSDGLAALAAKCESRAAEWSACAVYRDAAICESIERMLLELAQDIRAANTEVSEPAPKPKT